MTTRQRSVLAIGAFVLLLSCLFVPWYAEDDGGYLNFGYTFFFSPNAIYLDLHRLVVEWVAILAGTAVAFFVSPMGRHTASGPMPGRGPELTGEAT